jgi:outer membrane lipoprotein carrier protein
VSFRYLVAGLLLVADLKIGTTVVGPAFRPALLSAQSGPANADAVARDLQRKYDRVTDFSADFVHTYRGGVLRQQATERGRLFVKKPGKMRWEYTAPEKKLFVSDGRKIYSYIPQDRQVVVSTLPQDDQAPTPALFLTGKGNIVRDFNVATDKVADAPAGSLALRLTPKKREPEYESLTLVVDPKTLNLQMLITIDSQGGRSAFAFSNLKENVGIADNQFVFQMPRNVEVVRAGGQ